MTYTGIITYWKLYHDCAGLYMDKLNNSKKFTGGGYRLIGQIEGIY